MIDDPTIRDLVATARADADRTEELSRRVHEPEVGADPDPEEAFLREVLGRRDRGDDERLVGVALGAARATGAKSAGSAASAGVASRRSRARWVPAAASALALAAAVVIFVRSRDGGGGLPTYEAHLTGTDAVDRAAPGGGVVVSPGASLVLVAQPREAVSGALEARGFAGCDGKLRKVDAPITIAPSGAARLQGTPESLFGPAAGGTCALAIAIGKPGTVPDHVEDAAARGIVLVRVDVVVRRQ